MRHGRAGMCGIPRGVGLTKTMKPAAGAVVGRIVRRLSVIVGLLGVVALACSGCAGGPEHLGAKPVDHHAVARVKTMPATSTTTQPSPSTTTSTSPTVKTNASTFTPAVAPAPAPATTTTTNPFQLACVWSNFVAKVSTDQGAYSPGQPVQIALVFANTGPACTVNETGYACPVVNIDNAAGALVWSSAAPASTGCPSTFSPTVLAANWSQSFSITWGQDSCTPGQTQACPGSQVPAGQYGITGQSSGGSSQIPAGPAATVNLTAANP